MNILLLNHNVSFRGGTFFRAFHFGRHLVRLGHDVTLCSISRSSRARCAVRRVDGLKLLESPDLLWGMGRSGWCPWDTLVRSRVLRRGDWDLIHAFDSRPVVCLPALYLKRRSRAKLVMDWADWWGRGGTLTQRPSRLLRYGFGPIETFFEEHFRSRADATTVISRALFRRATSLGIAPETILYIPHGSDVEGIRVLDRDRCRLELGLPANAVLLGHLGTALAQDADLLFATFDALHRHRPEAQLILIGNHRIPLAGRSLPPGGVRETGFLSSEQINRYLGACDLMLLPLHDSVANRGRWPSKINDYWAAGRAVVTTPVGDLPPLFERHSLGRLCAPDPESLAQGVLDLLADRAARETCEATARRVAEMLFSWPVLTDALNALYVQVVGAGLGGCPLSESKELAAVRGGNAAAPADLR